MQGGKDAKGRRAGQEGMVVVQRCSEGIMNCVQSICAKHLCKAFVQSICVKHLCEASPSSMAPYHLCEPPQGIIRSQHHDGRPVRCHPVCGATMCKGDGTPGFLSFISMCSCQGESKLLPSEFVAFVLDPTNVQVPEAWQLARKNRALTRSMLTYQEA